MINNCLICGKLEREHEDADHDFVDMLDKPLVIESDSWYYTALLFVLASTIIAVAVAFARALFS